MLEMAGIVSKQFPLYTGPNGRVPDILYIQTEILLILLGPVFIKSIRGYNPLFGLLIRGHDLEYAYECIVECREQGFPRPELSFKYLSTYGKPWLVETFSLELNTHLKFP